MRIYGISTLTLIVVSILLSGCVIQSRQLNGLLGLINEPSLDLSKNSWLVRYSDYESVVYAVSTSEGVLFSNYFGDQIFFDGWAFRSIRGLGRRQININIFDTRNIRIIKRGNRIVSKHRCDQWTMHQNQGVVKHTQHCSDKQGYKNSILVKENGDISLIRQIVDERYTALTLTKLNY